MFVFGLIPKGLQTALKAIEWICSGGWAALCEKGIVSQNMSPGRAAKVTRLCSTPRQVFLQPGHHARKRKLTQSVPPRAGP